MTAGNADLFPVGGSDVVTASRPGNTGTTQPRRHDRVWLAADWRAYAPGAPADPRLDGWIAAGRALVTRRRDPSAPAEALALGVALPLAEQRARIGFVVGRRAVARVAPPIDLAELVDHAIPRQAALRDLIERGAACETVFGVYGSYAWEAISGEPCVTSSSDIDLLWSARDGDHVARVIDLLLRWESEHDFRPDGEARFADGADIAWRELAKGDARVLVKRDDGVALERSPLNVK